MRSVISFHYTLTNEQGEVIDSSSQRGPLAFLEGGHQIIPGLEKELLLLKVGNKKQVKVQAKDAYGVQNPQLLIKVEKEQLPSQKVKVGDMFRGGPDNNSPVFTVKEVAETEVTLDGNHPLAGQNLTFDVEITSVRPATEEELAHGHSHGGDGHHH